MSIATDTARALAADTLALVAGLRLQVGSGTLGTSEQRADLAADEVICAALIAGGGSGAFGAGLGRLSTAYGRLDDLLDGIGPAPPPPGEGGRLDGSDATQSGVNAIFL